MTDKQAAWAILGTAGYVAFVFLLMMVADYINERRGV